MPEIGLTIGGDPSGALAAIGAVKAALAGLQSKSITVDVKTSMDKALGDLGNVAKAHERAAESARDHANAEDRASSSARDGANASDRAAGSARDHASASDRAAESARDRANAEDRVASSARDEALATDKATTSARDQASASERAAEATRGHAKAMDSAGDSAKGSSAWFAQVSEWMDQAGRSATRADESMGSLGTTAHRAGASMGSFGAGASSGMAKLEALRGASEAVAKAQDKAQAATRDYDNAYATAFTSAPGKTATEKSQHATLATGSERAAMDEAQSAYRSAGREAKALKDTLKEVDSQTSRTSGGLAGVGRSASSSASGMAELGSSGSRISKTMSGISEALGGFGDKAEASISGASGAVRGVGMGALYAAAGMGILTAATAGIGVAGAFGDIAKSGPMMNQARNAMHDFTHEFTAMSGATASAGLGPMKGLSATVKALGGELAKVGVQNMGGILGGASTLVAATTGAISQLEPAIGPAITATTALGKAVIGAFGNSGAAITSFANTVTAQSPGIQAGLEGVVQIAGQVGEVVAKAAGTMGPGINGTGETAAGGIGQFIRSISPKWVGQASDAVDRALGVTTDAQGNVWAGGGGPAAADNSFGTSAGSTPHATGMRADPGAPGGQRPFAPGEFSGSSFGWHMPAGSAPLVSGASNDMSGVVSDMAGGGGLGGGSSKQAPPPKPGAPYGAVTPGTAGPVAATAGSDAPGGAAAAPKAPPPPPPPAAGAPVSGAPAAGIMPQGPGSAGPLPAATAAVHALNMAMAQTAPAAAGAGAASAQAGAQIGSSLGEAASKAATSTASVTSSMQGAQQAAAAPPPPPPPPPAAAAAAAAAPPPPPPPPAPPAPAAAAMAKTVAAVKSSAPAAAAGGEDAGAAAGSGFGKGVTKEITNTLTIVKKWIVKVIDTAASALDAHSPSRVFAALGSSIPQGLVVGMQAEAPAALSATQAMIKQVTSGAQAQLSSAQTPLAKAYAAALTPPQAQQLAQQPQTAVGSSAVNPKPTPPAVAQKNAEDEKRKQDENRKKEEADRRAATFEANKKGLEERGLTPESAARKAALEQAHNEKAKQLRDRRQVDKDSAILRARGETPVNTGDPEKDAAANRARADAATNKIKLRDANKDRALKELGIRPQTDAEKAAAPPPPGSSKAKDFADKKAKSDANAVAAKNTLKNFPGVEGGVKQSANAVGKAVPDGMTGGINQNAGGPADAAGKMAGAAIDAAKKKTKTKSPSQEFHDIGKSTAEGMANGMGAGSGLATGIGAGISDATSAIMGIASDRGLQLGYRYATSMQSGISSVLKSDDFKAAAIPQIDSPQAKAYLGDQGLLGPAGSGASVWKSLMVGMGAGTPAAPPAINLTLNLDGQPFRQLVLDQNDNLVNAILNGLKLQKN